MSKEQVLQQCTIEGNIVKLPTGQLDRNVYMEVAKALNLIGGKWKGGKVAGFVFPSDPTELLNQIASGEKRNLKKEFQFFATPDELANKLVYYADLKEHDTILEPSAGQGAIIKAINGDCNVVPDCYELMETNRLILEQKMSQCELRCRLVGHDFLENNGKTYSKIIANPPFTRNQDIDHVEEMLNCLKPGGRLVSIVSESCMIGEQKKQKKFRQLLSVLDAEIVEIERGSFKESGTMVGGNIIIINK